MPSRWEFTTNAVEIEEAALAPPSEHTVTFDGYWRATFVSGIITKQTVVCISGTNIWHNCEKFATLKVVNRNTCVLITKDEDVKGHLSDNGCKIEWEDGDIWPRVVNKSKAPSQDGKGGVSQIDVKADNFSHNEVQAATPESRSNGTEATELGNPKGDLFTAADAIMALFKRDAAMLKAVLNDGIAVNSEVDVAQLWQHMHWDPAWDGPLPSTPLLVATILLQWPQGVEVCVQHGADVNSVYMGPFRCADGSVASEAKGAHILRVGLSARGPAQCTICQHILAGKLRGRTFQNVRRKAKTEMEFATAAYFDSFQGPFLEQ